MSSKRMILLLILTLVFAGISGVAVARFGYLALWRLPLQDAGTVQLFADLLIAMLLVTSWMLRDARTSGVPARPYVALTVAAGSFGPLLYLLHREWRRARR
jgi:hypothetical protein